MYGWQVAKSGSVPVPEAVGRRIKLCSAWLGGCVLFANLILVPVLFSLQSVVLPGSSRYRMNFLLPAGFMSLSVFIAGVVTVCAVGSVQRGRLRLSEAIGIARLLRGCWMMTTAMALLTWGSLGWILSGPPAVSEEESGFGAAAWVFVGLLFVSVGLSALCYLVLRPMLWRSDYALNPWRYEQPPPYGQAPYQAGPPQQPWPPAGPPQWPGGR